MTLTPLDPCPPLAPCPPLDPGPRPLRRAARRRDTSLVGQLNREWEGLLGDPRAASAVRAWGAEQAALRGLPGLGGLEARVAADADATLLALLRCADAGLPLAARAVLQLMLPKAVRVARSQAGYADPEEAVAAAVSALWQAVVCYPLARRPARVAANLAMETLAGTRRELAAAAAARRGVPLDGLGELAAPGQQRAVDEEVHRVLLAAVRARTVSLAEARLLARVYTVDGAGRPVDPRVVAAEEALSWPALRQRCSRTVRRLAAAPTG